MSLIKTTLLLLLLLFISILFSSVFLENPYTDLHIINDFGDRFIYSQRAHWYVFDKIPYTEVFSEYPQVATYFFALPYFILQLTGANTPFQVIHGYAAIFSMLMMMFAVATIWLIHYFRKDKKYLALLLLLPVSFYFIHNRYDIIPAFLALLSLFFLHKKKFLWATIILAVGVMAKWYLVILFPIYLAYYYWQTKKINWQMILIFILTIFIIILPTLLSGGIEGLLVPYEFHLTRNYNFESLFFILFYIFEQTSDIRIDNNIILTSFLFLQFIIVPLALTSKIESFEKVIKWSLLAILFFILFAKFYSPQWILWFSPLYIILIRKKSDIFWLVIFDLLTYLYFPILYYTTTGVSAIYFLVITAKTLLLIKFISPLLKELIKDNLIFSYLKKTT